jgi:hypothetical protein
MSIIGATEGVIMPTIITTHMANTKANSIGFHGSLAGIIRPWPEGIMRKPVISMPPMDMSSASQRRSAQARAVTQ